MLKLKVVSDFNRMESVLEAQKNVKENSEEISDFLKVKAKNQ